MSSFSQACRERVEALLHPNQPPKAMENNINCSAESTATAEAATVPTGEDEIVVEVIPPACLTDTTTTTTTTPAMSSREGLESTTGPALLPLYGSFWACAASLFDHRNLFDGNQVSLVLILYSLITSMIYNDPNIHLTV